MYTPNFKNSSDETSNDKLDAFGDLAGDNNDPFAQPPLSEETYGWTDVSMISNTVEGKAEAEEEEEEENNEEGTSRKLSGPPQKRYEQNNKPQQHVTNRPEDCSKKLSDKELEELLMQFVGQFAPDKYVDWWYILNLLLESKFPKSAVKQRQYKEQMIAYIMKKIENNTPTQTYNILSISNVEEKHETVREKPESVKRITFPERKKRRCQITKKEGAANKKSYPSNNTQPLQRSFGEDKNHTFPKIQPPSDIQPSLIASPSLFKTTRTFWQIKKSPEFFSSGSSPKTEPSATRISKVSNETLEGVIEKISKQFDGIKDLKPSVPGTVRQKCVKKLRSEGGKEMNSHERKTDKTHINHRALRPIRRCFG